MVDLAQARWYFGISSTSQWAQCRNISRKSISHEDNTLRMQGQPVDLPVDQDGSESFGPMRDPVMFVGL